MRITVDIDDEVLSELAALTGESKRSPAVAKAVSEYVRRAKMRELGRMIREGAFANAFDEDYDPSKFDS